MPPPAAHAVEFSGNVLNNTTISATGVFASPCADTTPQAHALDVGNHDG
jgi:hypothetical protein